jgi:U4/U6 small nuclear ribonucleoprotein PRP31
MSLADSLLADLDDLSDDEEQSPQPSSSTAGAGPSFGPGGPGMMLPPPLPSKAVKRPAEEMEVDEDEEDLVGENGATLGFVPEGGVRPAVELDADEVEETDMTEVEDVSKVARLMTGTKLPEVLAVSLIDWHMPSEEYLKDRAQLTCRI